MRQPCKAGFGDQHVVLRRIETRADPADDLAIDDDRKTALHLDEPGCVTAAIRP
jgi:hypothetical protein